MQGKIFNFSSFINEASLSGNRGLEREGSSFLDKSSRESMAWAREFERTNREDIMGFQGLIRESKRLQQGKETALAQLVEDTIKSQYGSLLSGIEFDIKLGEPTDVRQSMEETPTETPTKENELEEITDEEVLKQIDKRKILRTLQQGRALNVKELLKLESFKQGLAAIMGDEAEDYYKVLTKITDVAKFFDIVMPIEAQKGAWQSREGFSGSCALEFEDNQDKADQEVAKKVLDALEEGDDVLDSEEADKLTSGIKVTVKAIGIDLGVLMQEAVKGVYQLITQRSLESLYGGSAEKVIANTDTLFDELEEIKFGPALDKAVFDILNNDSRIDSLIKSMDDDFDQIASLQEQLKFLFFGTLALLEPDEMLDIVYGILNESRDILESCEGIIGDILNYLEEEEEYQREMSGGARQEEPTVGMESEPEFGERDQNLSQEEINNLILDAFQKGGREAAEAVRKKYLGESMILPYSIWRKLNS